MMKGRNNGKKLMAVRIVAHAFEIIHLLSDQNPVQVCSPILTRHASSQTWL
jgi:small subunit ribosomal protein S5e